MEVVVKYLIGVMIMKNKYKVLFTDNEREQYKYH